MEIYKNPKGERLVGTTTVVGLLNKPNLIPWANNLGLEGKEVKNYVDDLASVGTLAHALIHEHLTGEKVDLNDYSKNDIDRAENAVISYYNWEKDKKIKVIVAEKKLVSEKYQYGGKPDILIKLNGEDTLIDLKTSNNIWPETFYQLAGYKILLEENGYKLNKAMIVRVGRDETEGFETRTITNFEPYERIFLDLLDVYKIKKKFKV